jgi:hypothetical protein
LNGIKRTKWEQVKALGIWAGTVVSIVGPMISWEYSQRREVRSDLAELKGNQIRMHEQMGKMPTSLTSLRDFEDLKRFVEIGK